MAKQSVSRLTGLPIEAKKTGTRKVNPAPRIGAVRPNRKSQVTGEKPSMRLVQRRKKNTRKGYYPNPIEPTKGLRYFVSGLMPKRLKFATIGVFKDEAYAREFAKRFAEKHPTWGVVVEKK